MTLRYTLLIFLLFSCLTGCVRHDPNAFYNGRQNFLNQNYGLAKKQLMGPAEAGNPEAQYAIGYMYLNGLGTPADTQMALKWITFSAKSGYQPAQEALQAIKPEITEITEYDNYAAQSAPSRRRLKKHVSSYHHPSRQMDVIEIPANEEAITQASRTDQRIQTAPRPLYNRKLQAKKEPHIEALMNTPDSFYTIQVIGAHDLKSIRHFVKTHRLEQQTHYYPTQRNGKTWYNLLYGTYSDSKEATQKLRSLPDSLSPLKPWVKPMKQVHQEISIGR